MHLVGFIIRIYHDARSSERQMHEYHLHYTLFKRKKDCEKTGKMLYTKSKKAWLSVHQFSRKSHMLNHIEWIFSVPDFTEIID